MPTASNGTAGRIKDQWEVKGSFRVENYMRSRGAALADGPGKATLRRRRCHPQRQPGGGGASRAGGDGREV